MPPLSPAPASERPLFATLRRFLPYLWPANAPALRARIVVALVLVVASKLVQVYGAPFALQGAIDAMAAGSREAVWLVAALVTGYAAARLGTVFFDNLRNAVFERVGQDATRRLASDVFRHLHRLSLRFHLERRTGRGHQGDRARHQEHRFDALFPAVQHRPDDPRAGAGDLDLLDALRLRPGGGDLRDGGDLYRLHALGDRLARQAARAE